MAFTRASRKRAYLKIAVTGPSGSGKTYSALQIAFGLAGKGGKVAMIDTENGSGELYADMGEYDVLRIEAPFLSDKYIDGIKDAVKTGYDVLIIDSISHQWSGDGGILARKEQVDNRGGNSFTNWAKFTPEHEAFKAAINESPIHVVATMRSKQDYVMTDSGGKSAPKKVGLAPIQRDGAEYEYTVVFDVAMNHEAAASKDRTGLFDSKIHRISTETGETLAKWLDGAVQAPEKSADWTSPSTAPAEEIDTEGNGKPHCEECGTGMTLGQKAVSKKRCDGKTLCPTCQKTMSEE